MIDGREDTGRVQAEIRAAKSAMARRRADSASGAPEVGGLDAGIAHLPALPPQPGGADAGSVQADAAVSVPAPSAPATDPAAAARAGRIGVAAVLVLVLAWAFIRARQMKGGANE